MKKIKILFFTGNRAELEFIKNAINSLNKYKNFSLDILVSGSHLDKKFGETIKLLSKKFEKNLHQIKILSSTKNLFKTSDYYSELTMKFSKFLKKKRGYDYIFISSDRFESFAIANVAFINQLQIIHYEGGDVTSGGSYDDFLRHSISRLSSLHFVTNRFSEKRLIKFGEEKKRISNIGLLSLKHKKYNLNKIIQKFKLEPNKFLILFTYHPVISRKKKNSKDISIVLSSLEKLLKEKKIQIIITFPNFDPYFDLILNALRFFKKKYSSVKFYKFLGSEKYHELLYYCGQTKNGACVGNSSSGIKEAEFFECPSINIGSRQNNRSRGNNVFDVKVNKNQIQDKIKLLSSKKNVKNFKSKNKIYYKKNSSKILSSKIINHYKKDFFSIKKCTY